MAVGVDLDQHIEAMALLGAETRQLFGCSHRLDQQRELQALAAQAQRVFELAGHDGHGIQDVADAGGQEAFGLLQRGHRDAACAGRDLPQHDLGTLAGLGMRAKAHAQRVHARLHALDVALHAGFVQQQHGGFEFGERVHTLAL